MDPQRTIAREVKFRGTGLHTGESVQGRILPAPARYGVRFIRTDLRSGPEIPALASYVHGTARSTLLKKGRARVMTVEHLLASLVGLGITNARVELDGPEVPAMDGSGLYWVRRLKGAGIRKQGTAVKYERIRRPLRLSVGRARFLVLPSEELRLSYVIEYDHPYLRRQCHSVVISPGSYIREIASARTFCFKEEVGELLRRGLIRGGSLKNALVVGPKGVLNKSLRFKSEFVRHKLLDLLGDLALLGRPLKAHIIAVQAGHAAHVRLVKEIVRKSKKYQD